MKRKIHTLSPKRDTFHLQPQPLFGGSCKTKFYCAPSPYHSLPRKPVGWVRPKKPCNGAVVQRISSCNRNLPVGRDFALRNGKNDAAKSGIAKLIRPQAALQDSICHLPQISKRRISPAH
jgi:hypothetical protein